MFDKLHNSVLPKYTVSVRKEKIEAQLKDVLVQFHRFPGTYSTVAHASLGGVELAIATSPCIDPRNFRESIGEHYSRLKVMSLAEDKLWEAAGLVLANLLVTSGLTEEEFYEKYKEEYLFAEIKTPATYKSAQLNLPS